MKTLRPEGNAVKARGAKGALDEANREMWRLCNAKNWDAIQERLTKGEWKPNRPMVFASQPGGLLLLSVAVEHSALELARKLIELGADVNLSLPGEAPHLVRACEAANQEMVKLLLEAGADVNAKSRSRDEGDSGGTPLIAAAETGRRDIVETLLHKGAQADAKTRRGRSALSMALENGKASIELLEYLLNAGCPVDGRDLHYPVLRRDLEAVRLLLSRKADVNRVFDWPTHPTSPKKGDTPIFVAVEESAQEMIAAEERKAPRRFERLAILDLLIEAGADVNAQRAGKGWTPLLIAVAQGDEEITARLINGGADVNREVFTNWNVEVQGEWIRRKGPLSARALATEKSDMKIRMLLREQ